MADVKLKKHYVVELRATGEFAPLLELATVDIGTRKQQT